jgi:hypothetical protein
VILLVRLIVYALLLMPPVLDAPTYDWRTAISRIANTVGTFKPPPSVYQTPTVYQGGGGAGQLPTPAPPPPAPGGHYNMPDYAALIQGDPGYAGVASQISAATDTAGRQRADAVRRALVQFGMAPPGWKGGYGDVDESTLAAAQQNPFSVMSTLRDQRGRGSADLAAVLGARGTLSSGALTGGEQVLQRQFDSSQAQATQQLLDALGGYEGGYANTVNDLEGQRRSAYADASGRVAQQYQPQWVADQQAAQAQAGAGAGGYDQQPVPPPGTLGGIPQAITDYGGGGYVGGGATGYTQPPPSPAPPYVNPAIWGSPPPGNWVPPAALVPQDLSWALPGTLRRGAQI